LIEFAFSAGERHRAWSRLSEEEFDLLVIGGGITGAGVARDAAGRGLRVALVDGADLSGGTSSRSSRLVHGGLRYLETFDFDLVFDSLRERRRLLELAPHLVRPLPFVFPVFRKDPTGLAKLGAGMWLYELLALFRSPHRPRLLSRAGVRMREPLLSEQGLLGGALYWDAQVDDARLTLSVARGAFEAGALVVSHAHVVALDPARGAAGQAQLEDGITGAATTVRARVILNATGPWSDRLRALADPGCTPRLRLTKGVHLLVPRERIENRHAIIFRSPVDGRVMFVLPWNDFTYVGTTDTAFSGDPATATADPADLDYLLSSVNALFPQARLTTADILSTWAGVRPLLAPAPDSSKSESATSREHEIWQDRGGLLNVAGGKLTTYRSMAAEVVDEVARILAADFSIEAGQYFTEYLPLPGAPDESMLRLEDEVKERCAELALASSCGQHLAQRYGTFAFELLDTIRGEPELGRQLVSDLPYLWAEVFHAVRQEMALTLEDILRRRVPIFYERADGGLPIAREVAERISGEPGLAWAEGTIEAQVQAYTQALQRTRPNF
jgi:glycerol-3-phosphate dehydrogenase